jgi:malate/lactate dehydrogenase
VGEADAVIVADPPELQDASADAAGVYAQGLLPQVGSALLLVAGAHGPAIVDAVVAKKAKRERVAGTAPTAFASAVRRQVADELRVRVSDVTALTLGLPPAHLVVPRASVTASGVAADALSPVVVRRAVEAVRKRRLGPVALATAAVAVLRAITGRPGALLCVTARLDGEYGHRGLALAVPARLGGGRVEVMETALEPVDRVALDTAAQRRFSGEEG